MRVAAAELGRELARRVAPLYTVCGRDPLLGHEAAAQIRAAARAAGHAERVVLTTHQWFDWSELRFAARNGSLFGSRRLLELRIPNGKLGRDGPSALVDYCAALPADTVTLVVFPALDWRAQKTRWFAALEAAGVMVMAEPLARDAVPGWIRARLQANGQNADDLALEFIASRCEGNLWAADQEVAKLALLYPPGLLGYEQVAAAVVDASRYDPTRLGPAALGGERRQIVRTLAGLRGEGAPLPLVLHLVAEDLRAAALLRAALDDGRAPAQALREARVARAKEGPLMAAARRLDVPRLRRALARLAEIDEMVKGLDRRDPWDELARLCLRLSARRERAAQPA
jgi:DNA polymerase-3 subunit delta